MSPFEGIVAPGVVIISDNAVTVGLSVPEASSQPALHAPGGDLCQCQCQADACEVQGV